MKLICILLVLIGSVYAQTTLQQLIEKAENISHKAYMFIMDETMKNHGQYLVVIIRDTQALETMIDDLKEHEKSGTNLTANQLDEIELAIKQYENRIQTDIDETLKQIQNTPNSLIETAQRVVEKANDYLKENGNSSNAKEIQKVKNDIEQLLEKLDKHPTDGTGDILLIDLGFDIEMLEEILKSVDVTTKAPTNETLQI
ncbi:hypothetical protein RDWZM_000349 [Blomia tropicalis]|uniref:Uncharacterized protein n=1 Tax=Blomia tropicalis TaxID=40697 RepID=A0A9Q0MA68_BLOTA|nr:hypothetical protein RDWZM_000349 [Blomia tropicalis]